RDAALPLFRRIVDRREVPARGLAPHRQRLGDRRCQRGLAMVNVANRPDVQVRLRSLKFLLAHRALPALSSTCAQRQLPYAQMDGSPRWEAVPALILINPGALSRASLRQRCSEP